MTQTITIKRLIHQALWLGLLLLLLPLSSYAQTTRYVNDNSTAGDVFTTAIGSDVNNGTAAAPYLTISFAISNSADGDIIKVDAGIYSENLIVNKSLTLLGVSAGNNPNTVVRSSESRLLNGSIMLTGLKTIIVDGFEIYQTNNVLDVILMGGPTKVTLQNTILNRQGTDSGKIVRAVTTSAGTGIKTIANNLFTGDASNLYGTHKTWNNAIYINGGGSTVAVNDNVFINCRTALSIDEISTGITLNGNKLSNSGTLISLGGVNPITGSYTFGVNDYNVVGTFINVSNADVNFRLDISSGSYGGTAFNALPLSALFAVDLSIYHKGRYTTNSKGLVTYVTNNIYAPNYTGAGGPIIDNINVNISYATAGNIINLQDGIFNQRAVITKSLTLKGQSEGGTILDGTTLGNGIGITINNGVSNVTIQDLTVQNFAGNGPNSFAGIYGKGGNNNLTVENTTIKNNLGGSGIYANGPIDNVLLNNLDISGHSNVAGAARGIVIWNGLKSNITITNSDIYDNNCCGIELQDGSATGVNISNNNVVNNGDNGLGLTGLMGPGSNVVSNNTVTDNGRFGIEIKNPNGSGLATGAGSVLINNNTVTRTSAISDVRDIAGIAVYRRGVIAANNNVDVPNGVIVQTNTVSGYTQASTSEGFGIVIEGTNHSVTDNNLSSNDIGIQQQAGYTPYPGDGDQANKPDTYFGRGNSPMTCGNTVSGNTGSNTINERNISVGGGLVKNTNTSATYCSIQSAINAATAGDVINVPAGIYFEDVTVNKSLTISGAGAATTKVSGPIGGASNATFRVAASGVTIEGFTITREGNNTTDWDNAGLNSAGVAIQSQGNNATIKNNFITGNRTGIDINNSNGNTVFGNNISFNRTGLLFRNQTDNTSMTQNFINNNWTVGILFLDASSGTNVPVQQALNSNFNDNNISGNWYGDIVDKQSGGSLPASGTNIKNFECNWYGISIPVVTTINSSEPGYSAQIPVAYGGIATNPGGSSNIMGQASANIDVVSWLLEATDDGNANNGFQPQSACLGDYPVKVYSDNTLATLLSSHTTIQTGVNASVAGNFIKVAGGVYSETVTINKAITIHGANAGLDPNTATRITESRISNGTFKLSGAGPIVIDGFEIYNTNATSNGAEIGGNTSATLQNTILQRIATTTGNTVYGLSISPGTGLKVIKNNFITGTGAASTSGHKTWRAGIYLNGSTGNSVAITDNIIEKCNTAINIDNMSAGITLDGNTLRTTGTYTLMAFGAGATGSHVFGVNDYRSTTAGMINLANVSNSFKLDISAGSQNGNLFSTRSLAQLFTLDGQLSHRDNSKAGLIYLRANNLYVTNRKVQIAIGYAAPGDVINVSGSGTIINESLIINKPLTLLGPNSSTSCTGTRSTEAKLAPPSGVPITITSNDVTVSGFDITAPKAFYAIDLGATSNTTISYNKIHDIGNNNTVAGSNVQAIVYTLGATNADAVNISNNCLTNIGSGTLTGFSASAISVIQTTSTGVLTGLNIANNAINNVSVNNGIWPVGKIAYGIQINVGGNGAFKTNNGNVKNANITFNSITGLSGHIATGIALEGNTENAIVERNVVSNLTATKDVPRDGGGYDSNGLKFENNKFVHTVTVQNNSFDIGNFGYAVANYVPVADGGFATLNCNWFGSANYGDLAGNNLSPTAPPTGRIFTKNGASTIFIPFLTDDIIDPTAGGYTCSPPVFATAKTLNVTYSKVSENIGVTFDLTGNSVAEYPIPGLTPPGDIAAITSKYVALKVALATGTADNVKAAALDLGDDIITEYFYMNGSTEVYLKTAGSNDLIKNKYWDQYLINTSSSTGYPNFGTALFVVPTGSYSTSTNPATAAVSTGWLIPAYGKDLHVRVTVVNNGNVSETTKTVFIDAQPIGPVDLYSDNFVTFVSSHNTIQAAVDAAGVTGHSIQVASGTYDEQVLVNKAVSIKGVGATKPIVNFTGTPALAGSALTAFKIISPDVTIENFEFKVDISKLGSAILTTGATLNLIVKDNDINPYRSSATTTSYGLRNAISINYGAFRVNAANPTFTIQGNSITYNNGTDSTPGNADDASFRSGLSADEAGGTFTTNTVQTVNHDAIIRFASAGAINVTNNNLNGGGLEFVDFNAGAGTLTISGNTFNGAVANTYSNALRLKNNTNAISTIVSGNTFTGFVGNVAGYGATLSMENYQAISIANNTFTPLANSTNYRHISVNTKDFSSSSGYFAPVVSADFTNNIFNGSGTVGGVAIGFYNWDNDNPIFNTFTIGTAGNENTFASDIATYIYLDNSTGTIAPNATARTPWNIDLNIANNQFASTLPTSMNKTQLFALEDKVVHALDGLGLGLVKWVANNDYVTTNTLGIQRGVDAATSGYIVNVNQGTYNETVSVTKSLTILGPNEGVSPNGGTRVTEAVLVNTATGRTFSIANGNTDVTISGFKFDGGSPIHDGNGSAFPNTSDVTFSNNFVVNANAIYAGATSSWADLLITDNKFEDINATATASAMQVSGTSTTTIKDNTFTNVNYSAMVIDATPIVSISGNTINGTGVQAIQLAGAIGDATVENNKIIDANRVAQAVDRGAIRLYGSGFTGAVLISNNEITGGYNGITVQNGQNITGKNITITSNSITNLTSGKAIYHGGTGTLNATCNWFGTTDQSAIDAKITGSVNFLPFLVPNVSGSTYSWSGIDTYSCTGLGPILVYDNDPLTTGVVQSSHMTIQSAIDMSTTMPGNYIIVPTGTYTENVNVNKSLTIRGANAGKNPNTVARTPESRLFDGTINVTGINTVVLDGFEVYQTNSANVILIDGESAVTLQNNIMNRQGAVVGNAGKAIEILAGTGLKTIANNKFTGNYNSTSASSKTWLVALDINGSNGNSIVVTDNSFEKSSTAINIDDMSEGITVLGNKFKTGDTWMSFGGVTPTTGSFAFGANDYQLSSGNFINLLNVDPSFRLDISAGTYYNVSFSTQSIYNLFTIESKISHRTRNAKNGLVYLVPNNQYVSYNSIQAAIDYAPTTGETISVRASNYTEHLLINKSIYLKGPNYNVPCGPSRLPGTEANIISSDGTAPITVTADGVTINGLGIIANKAFNAIDLGNTSNTTIAYNNIHDIGTNNSASGSNVHAILYSLDAVNKSNVNITNNCLNNIGRSNLTGNSASAIAIVQSTATAVLVGLNITDNTISNVKVSTAAWPTGKIAYGIIINVGGNGAFATTNGNVKNAVISFNTISGISGHIATGIALEGNTELAKIERNVVSSLTATKSANRAGGGYDLNGLKFENNKYVSTVTVQNNSFDVGVVGYAVANYVPAAIGGVATLNCNWLGSADYGALVGNYMTSTPSGKIFTKEGASTMFIPYLSNAIIDPADGGYTCLSSFASPTALNVAYTAASDNIVLNFDLIGNSVAEYPIPGLNPAQPADLFAIATKYNTLQVALKTGTTDDVKAAALDLGDDIITEYFYMDGSNEILLKTTSNNDLIKNKYYDQYLVNSGTTVRYPNFGSSLFVVPVGSYATSTNPLTGLVPNGWLVPVYGKDLHVRVTVVNNGNVSRNTQTVLIDAVPVTPVGFYSGTSIITSFEAGSATANKTDAYLNIVSNNQGIVITRINGTISIINPVEGMIIYDTSDNKFKVNTTGTNSGWRPFAN